MYPKVRFYVEGGMYSEFLNKLTGLFIIMNIIPENLGFTATCYAEDYKEIARLSAKYQCKIKVKSKIGVYFKINKFIDRPGIRLGLIIYFILTFIFSHIIWSLDINSDDYNLKNEIYNSLYRQGIYAGSYYDKQKLKDACKKTIIELKDYADISLNFYKGVIHCNINPRYEKENYLIGESESDIKANLSGVLTDVRVYSGFSKVELGQSVSEGDTLVSSLEIDQFNNIYYEKTRAYIEAICDKTYSVYIPYEKDCKLYTGEYDKEIYINILNQKIRIKPSYSENWKYKSSISKVKYLSFLGFHFPITVEEITHYEIDTFKIESDPLTRREIAMFQIGQMIKNDVKLKEEVRRYYDYKLNDKGLRLICTVNGYYEIT